MKYLFITILLLLVNFSVDAEELNQPNSRVQEKSTTLEQAIPYKRDDVVDSSYLGKLAVVLISLLSLAGLILFILNKLGIGINMKANASTGGQHIKLLEVKRLSTKITMFYMEVDNTPLVLAQSGDSMLLINKKDWGLEITERR